MRSAKAVSFFTRLKDSQQQWSHALNGFYDWLMQPVHASSLGTFRLVYSYIMFAQTMKWAFMFDTFQTTIYTLHYPGVGWIKPVSPPVGNFLLGTCSFCSILLGFGFMTRLVSIINYLTFAYLFHICHSFYNNHYVLMCHINFVGCFVNWGTWGAMDTFLRKRLGRRVETTVPYWHLLLMQLLFCVPYFWGAVAKMNSDWLFRAQPLTSWFHFRQGLLYKQWWFSWFIAWTGMGYDLTISFLLMWKRTRFLLGFPGAIFFNCCNKIMFNIGVFPMAMIASLVLFLNPEHPARLWHIIAHASNPDEMGEKLEWKFSTEDVTDENKKYKSHKSTKDARHKIYILTFVISFLLFHSIYPLRHFFLYKSNPSWTEEGHTGAWHMKLRSKHGWVYLQVTEKNGNITLLSPQLDPGVTKSQSRKIESRPEDMILYITRLDQIFDEAQRPTSAINCFSLNSNPARELYISSANLKDYIGKNEWIGTTVVQKWVYPHNSAPPCNRAPPPFDKKGDGGAKVRSEYHGLYHQANFYTAEELDFEDEPRGNIYHIPEKSEHPENVEYGYLWNVWNQ